MPRTIVRDWRHGKGLSQSGTICPRCWRPSLRPIVFSAADYSELLALYLGDGHIVRTGRSDRLRIFLDTRYTEIISDARALLRRCFPAHSVGVSRSRKGTTTIVSLYSTHLACLFPQHAPGGKHDRSIVLEPWQADILERDPWPFLRGCIRSDGCAFVNRTGPYEYLAHAATRWSEGLRHTLGSASSRLWRNQADAPSSGGGGLTPVEVRILSAASEKPR